MSKNHDMVQMQAVIFTVISNIGDSTGDIGKIELGNRQEPMAKMK